MAEAKKGEIVPLKKQLQTMQEFLERMQPALVSVLPKHVTPARIAGVVLNLCVKTPMLLRCTPQSLAGAVLTCSEMGLEPDGIEAHLVPFKNGRLSRERGVDVYEVTLIPDYKGLVKLARQSRQIKSIDFREVRAGDEFRYEYGSKAFLWHKPSAEPIHSRDAANAWTERAITHCYALASTTDGGLEFEVMRREDIEWHRDRYSRAAGDGPWTQHFDAMGAKTCFKKLRKRLPYSRELAIASDLDDKVEEGLSQDLGAIFEVPDGDGVGPAGGRKSALDTLADKMEEKGNGKETAQAVQQRSAEGTPSPTAENGKETVRQDHAPTRQQRGTEGALGPAPGPEQGTQDPGPDHSRVDPAPVANRTLPDQEERAEAAKHPMQKQWEGEGPAPAAADLAQHFDNLAGQRAVLVESLTTNILAQETKLGMSPEQRTARRMETLGGEDLTASAPGELEDYLGWLRRQTPSTGRQPTSGEVSTGTSMVKGEIADLMKALKLTKGEVEYLEGKHLGADTDNPARLAKLLEELKGLKAMREASGRRR